MTRRQGVDCGRKSRRFLGPYAPPNGPVQLSERYGAFHLTQQTGDHTPSLLGRKNPLEKIHELVFVLSGHFDFTFVSIGYSKVTGPGTTYEFGRDIFVDMEADRVQGDAMKDCEQSRVILFLPV